MEADDIRRRAEISKILTELTIYWRANPDLPLVTIVNTVNGRRPLGEDRDAFLAAVLIDENKQAADRLARNADGAIVGINWEGVAW